MKKLLLILSEFENAHFFPDGYQRLADSLNCQFRMIKKEEIEDFAKTLSEYAPEIIVGGWDMPPIPLESLKANGGSLEYFCFLSGSTKKQITVEHLDAGLIVSNWGNWIGPYVAECALLLILSALRHVACFGYRLRTDGIWRDRLLPCRSLYGKRVGLHGFGAIAQSLVELMQPFQPIITADTGVPDALLKKYHVKRATSTESLFEESEVLVELKPLTESTQKSVTEDLLRRLPVGACFVNIGRGKVVDEAALIRVAREGNIQVALDVYEEEPLPKDSPLRELNNVFLLPHMGGATIDRGKFCGEQAFLNVQRYLAGEALRNPVDRETFERST